MAAHRARKRAEATARNPQRPDPASAVAGPAVDDIARSNDTRAGEARMKTALAVQRRERRMMADLS